MECADDDCQAAGSGVKTAETDPTPTPTRDADQHDDSLCLALHSVCPVSAGPVLAGPELHPELAWDLRPATGPTRLEPSSGRIGRQPPDRETAGRPVVCLDAALHSLAPPAVL